MSTINSLILVFVALAFSVPAEAGFTFFTSRSSWEAAVGTFSTENFNSVATQSIAPGVTQIGLIQFSHPGPNALGGLPATEIATGVNGTPGITAAVGIDGHPMFGNLPEYNDYILPWTANAFGANWESASSAAQLVLTAPDGSINLPDHLPYPGTGFFGFITDTPFTTLRVTGLSTLVDNAGEIYSIDNISFNGSAVVPEPASYVVLAAGLSLILGRRRVKSVFTGSRRKG